MNTLFDLVCTSWNPVRLAMIVRPPTARLLIVWFREDVSKHFSPICYHMIPVCGDISTTGTYKGVTTTLLSFKIDHRCDINEPFSLSMGVVGFLWAHEA